MHELHLFAGAGGGILGGQLLGHTAVCAVEIEEYARQVLLQRQRDGILPRFPIWDDITTFDGKPWRGSVDVVAGGFPCQDISSAGKGAGISGERSGLWSEMYRVVCEVRPRFVFVENSPMLTIRGLNIVLGNLAEGGYNAKWCVLGADDLGLCHRRKRIWILAHANGKRLESSGQIGNIEEARWARCGRAKQTTIRVCTPHQHENAITSLGDYERVANRLDRLKAIGNGQVPAVAAAAFRMLSAELNMGERDE